ncbi:hypothetical protein CXG81DRAFT_27262 [Caulochytrium protostelioides]|uniref:Uncharacterized protein n=1 Tax=Caulochytrium protostelioides TaxID=1555241 RepID=A0A4P9X164_9FUNG|nr:hypothetical protein CAUPRSCDRAFT_10542 [Caulochytrium protostelioides]RKP00017.1 hypothetical protein CXG81DRAFT_27262 [Caulochytrium protostelioides]|eukprot:RKP00017.1 hypothetical protein CXG81DRAFT_27262 [Caulochytrium protostelioides]
MPSRTVAGAAPLSPSRPRSGIALAKSVLMAGAAMAAVAALPGAQAFSGLCTYHNYEGDMASRGSSSYDSSPGWCGYRYSSMDLSRVMAMNSINGASCNTCWAVRDASKSGPPTYILAIDQKGAEGLDIALTAFKAIFPYANPADPQTCAWEQVDTSYCFDVCRGSDLECTQSLRNTLPISQLGSPAGTGNLRYANGQLAKSGAAATPTPTIGAPTASSPAATVTLSNGSVVPAATPTAGSTGATSKSASSGSTASESADDETGEDDAVIADSDGDGIDDSQEDGSSTVGSKTPAFGSSSSAASTRRFPSALSLTVMAVAAMLAAAV